ncbi:hypothetical protein Glove_306g28 [Diversispora epigaea]|uniref:Uncharacterized protein n=1 Tax=Diversispora epigaea TaxID=1348612 RepID=A0A397HX73_9GLOM|nr:hypothetical protein Glove_306g28 [Diversispora epigaea]
MNFYKSTPIEKWSSTNIVEYYRKENLQQTLPKILDSVKKDLIKVTSADSDFDVERRKKAQNIVDTWKRWSAPVKEGSKTKYELNQIFQRLEKLMAKQEINATKNSASQVDIIQKKFVDNSRKRTWKIEMIQLRRKKKTKSVKLVLSHPSMKLKI